MFRGFSVAVAAFVIVFTLAASPLPASSAVVHGTAYEWSTFDALEDVIIEVNSTPPQFLVAQSGDYSFELPEGAYTIRAEHYQNNLLEYCAEEEIVIVGDGEFVLDLLMFPSIEEEFLCDDLNFSEDLYNIEESDADAFGEDEPAISTETTLILGILALVLLLASGYVFLTRRKKRETGGVAGEVAEQEPVSVPEREPEQEIEPEPVPEPEPEDIFRPDPLPESHTELPSNSLSDIPSNIPSDLQEVISIIRGEGGRITQKELRARLRYSEAKVSLMITDLEDRRIVKKVKKGRGNVIILTDG